MTFPRGHRREELTSAGERTRIENSWTWVCECGATESASTKVVALDEWRFHMQRVRERDKLTKKDRAILPKVVAGYEAGKGLGTIAKGLGLEHSDVERILYNANKEGKVFKEVVS